MQRESIVARSLDDITADMAALVREAFQAGQEAQSEVMRQKLASILAGEPVVHWNHRTEDEPRPQPTAEGQRSAPGTVKPRVLAVLRDNPEGLATTQVTALAGIKHNSVRGTLWSLQKSGYAERRGDRWFPTEPAGKQNPTVDDMFG
jgi:hypothetical protein